MFVRDVVCNGERDFAMKRTVALLHAWLPVFFMMSVIFYFSHQRAAESSKLSGSLTEAVAIVIEALVPFMTIDSEFLHFFIRKGAHFTVYFILGVTLIRACSIYFARKRRALYAFIIACLYAISDEVHQLFIPGRSGEIGDVLIDSFGALIGIFIYLRIRRKFCR